MRALDTRKAFPSVMMIVGIPRRFDSMPLMSPRRVRDDDRHEGGHPRVRPSVDEQCADEDRDSIDPSDREIDLSHGQEEHHPEGHDPVVGRRARHDRQRVGGEEARVERSDDDDQHQHGGDHAEFFDLDDSMKPAPAFGRGSAAGAGRRRPCRRAGHPRLRSPRGRVVRLRPRRTHRSTQTAPRVYSD